MRTYSNFSKYISTTTSIEGMENVLMQILDYNDVQILTKLKYIHGETTWHR